MLTPAIIRGYTFQKKLGGYKAEDVDAFLTEVISSYDELYHQNKELSAKNQELEEKLKEYRADEDNIRVTMLSAQRTAESIVREAKHRAELTLQDAHIKAGQIEANARRSIVEEQKVLEGIQEEVSAFKARLIEIYKEHIALIQSLPGKVEAEEPEPERAEEPEDQETVDFAAMQEPEAPAEIPQPDGEEKAAAEIDKKFEEREADVPVSMFSTLKFGEDYDVTKDPS